MSLFLYIKMHCSIKVLEWEKCKAEHWIILVYKCAIFKQGRVSITDREDGRYMDIHMNGWVYRWTMDEQMNRKTDRELHAADHSAWVKHQLKNKS